ncbi:signal recognition particle protein [Defluviicoccus vanus]|uniref:Signal recognition particle protein n=1 Tax=Defluviicoccus vanus TaxID=111831 RepID=A0A7H1N4H7_9PROT|nr:signal recognition particle protein [Defluviicoccus vanus]QNT70613.1 signal recognition particle protein [Defluviicoccus vanus]
MFEGLTERLGTIFDRLRKRGALSEADVNEALREVRIALLEADVALPVVKDLINGIKARAVGQEVLRSVTPAQMVVKIVHDHLIEVLSGGETDEKLRLGEGAGINLNASPPVPVLLVGLQGSGKTTTAGKLAVRLRKREKKKVLLASLDIYRPAAQKQLAILGEQTETATVEIIPGQDALTIAQRAMDQARRQGFDVVILDTAGRTAVDEQMMAEAAAVKAAVNPLETLLVADALTGQDAVTLARSFHERVGITGIVLTRVDGDSRGGAALSMRGVTGCPIRLIGVGEKLDALETFQPDRIAGRILGMGDVVGLVERAADLIEKEDAEKLALKLTKGEFTLEDMAKQFKQLRKMGDFKGILGMLPGIGKIQKQLDEAKVDDKMIARQEAIILSMTIEERHNPKLLNASRRRRIALGSGTTVQDVNRLLKQHQMMSEMMKKVGKLGKRGLFGKGLPPGLLPPMPPR